jgi:hypothetical protein
VFLTDSGFWAVCLLAGRDSAHRAVVERAVHQIILGWSATMGRTIFLGIVFLLSFIRLSL